MQRKDQIKQKNLDIFLNVVKCLNIY